MRDGGILLRKIGFLIAVTGALVVVPAASGDAGSPNYSSRLTSVVPNVKGLTVRVVDGDDAIELRNATGRNVMVPGYEREPYLRFLANGRVEVNVNSPAKYLNEERYGGVPVPKEASPEAKPKWQLIEEDGSYTWHEHRIHWMSTEQPPRVKESGGGALMKIFDWTVPLKVGAERVQAGGTLWWVPTGQLERADALIAAAVAKEARRKKPPAAAKAETGTNETEAAPATEEEAAPATLSTAQVAPDSSSGSSVLWLVIAALVLTLLATGAYALQLRRRRDAGRPAGEVW